MTALRIQTKHGPRFVGKIEGDRLKKSILASRHIHRALQAIGFDAGVIEALPPEVKFIEVREKEQDVTYWVDVETFRLRSVERDYGHGRQYLLPLSFWTREESEQPALFPLPV